MLELIDIVGAAAVRMLARLFYYLPVGLVIRVGRVFGLCMYFLGSKRRGSCYTNLRAAFCVDKTPSELKALTKSVYKNLGAVFAELLCYEKIDAAYVAKYITVENVDYLAEASKKGKGIIFLSAHFGCWELACVVAALRGYPLYILAREQTMKRLNELINRVRESKGSKVVRKGITTKYIVKALHEGKVIGMVADQSGGANGLIADFFGRPVPTAYGPYRIAQKTGAIIIPVFAIRRNGPYHRISIEKPFTVGPEEDLSAYVRYYNELLEKYVRANPDHWLWLHRRWKRCAYKKIVVLSDGKPGHLNQSLALAGLFERYRKDKGIKAPVDVEVLDIKFKDGFRKVFIGICSIFSGRACRGCMNCLKFGLERESYEKLEKTYADVVISAGFSLAPVNAIFSNENNAKNAIVMRPGLPGARSFGMVIVPSHDRGVMKGKNVFRTDIALNRIDPDAMAAAGAELSKKISADSDRFVGILIGGGNDYADFDGSYVKEAVLGIREAAKKRGMKLLLTTSRRTPRAVDDALESVVLGDGVSKLAVIASKNNPPGTVPGILALSEAVIVTGESVSMVSEAVSSGKRVLVLAGRKKKKGVSKHDVFLRNLEEKGLIRITDAPNAGAALAGLLEKSAGASNESGATDEIYRNMWRLDG